jgi:hypothetical protein
VVSPPKAFTSPRREISSWAPMVQHRLRGHGNDDYDLPLNREPGDGVFPAGAKIPACHRSRCTSRIVEAREDGLFKDKFYPGRDRYRHQCADYPEQRGADNYGQYGDDG